MSKFMFDTNIFNHILDGRVDNSLFTQSNQYFVTHIQADEIKNTKNGIRRQELIKIFQEINQTKVVTESAVYGISKYGGAKYGGGKIFHRIRDELNLKKTAQQINNTKDALIAETCIKNNFTLVTDDRPLYESMKEHNGLVKNLTEFLKELKHGK